MIYLDSNVFIAAAIDTGKEGEAARKTLAGLTPDNKGCTSFLTLDEVIWKVRKHRGSQEALRAGRAMLDSPAITFIEVDSKVARDALDIMEKLSFDPRDAIHAASMKAAGCNQIASFDAHFDKLPASKRIQPQ